jgi:hypothetical protein
VRVTRPGRRDRAQPADVGRPRSRPVAARADDARDVADPRRRGRGSRGAVRHATRWQANRLAPGEVLPRVDGLATSRSSAHRSARRSRSPVSPTGRSRGSTSVTGGSWLASPPLRPSPPPPVLGASPERPSNCPRRPPTAPLASTR